MDILLIDDEPDVRKSLTQFLGKLGHGVCTASDGPSGLKLFHSGTFDVVITDIRMPGLNGLELLRRIKRIERSPVDVVVITGHGDMDNAIMALKYGAYDYLRKPINVRELAITLERIEEYSLLRRNYLELKEEFDERVERVTEVARGEVEHLRAAYLEELGLDGLCVYSEAMRRVVSQAEKYSKDRQVSVLIEGESGTGKELIARFIHHYGNGRTTRPFVAINCGAVSPNLFEGELFGHEPGAYTGATARGRVGKLEAANGGSVFLDEIGEMPAGLQMKLLRVLEDRTLYRLGGVKEVPIDVRIISATNKDIKEEVQTRRFRLDLFYRINMGHIHIPSLRQRPEDILPLAHRFVSRACSRKGSQFGEFSPSAERFLVNHHWPGNVRELKNAMERLAIMCPCVSVESSDLAFLEETETAPMSTSLSRPVLGRDDFLLPEDHLDLDALNDRIVGEALRKHQGNQTQTAQYLGISRRVLQGKLQRKDGDRP